MQQYVAFASLLIYVGAGIFWLRSMYVSYSRLRTEIGQEFDWGFRAYLRYVLASWLSSGLSTELMILAIFAIFFLFVGSGLACFAISASFDQAIFYVYSMMVDPATAVAQRTVTAKVLGVFMVIGFLVITGLGLAMIQDGFSQVMHSLRMGREPVLEAGHTLLIGYNEDTCQLIGELCQAYEPQGGTVIVLLAEERRQDVERDIGEVNFRNSRVAVRCGKLSNVSHLRLVSAGAARVVMVLPKRDAPHELRDASVMSILVVLCGKGWPVKGRILATCSLGQNQPLLRDVGGPSCDVVNIDRFLGKLVVQCSHQPGVGSVICSLFSFAGGPKLCVARAPEALLGRSFGQARFRYPAGVLVGVMNGGGCRLCPGTEYVLAPGDELLVLADGTRHLVPVEEPSWPEVPLALRDRSEPPARGRHQLVLSGAEEEEAETILVLGWNCFLIGAVLPELENHVKAGSKVIILAPQPVQEREDFIALLQTRTQRFANLQIQQVAGRPGSRPELDLLPVKVHEASRIFVLSDHSCSAQAADACTIMTVMLVRELIASSGERREVPIVPEIRDHDTERVLSKLNVSDLVDSSGISAQVLAALACTPRLVPVLEELISEDKAEVRTWDMDVDRLVVISSVRSS